MTPADLRQSLDQVVLGDDPRRRLRITLDAVLRSQSRGGLEVVGVGLQQIVELDEELVEAGWEMISRRRAGSSVAFRIAERW